MMVAPGDWIKREEEEMMKKNEGRNMKKKKRAKEEDQFTNDVKNKKIKIKYQ